MERNSSIPDDVITEILSRLPVKSLCRFLCVSVQWYYTISDQVFVESHYRHALSRSDGTSLIISFPGDKRCVRSVYSVDRRDNVAVNVLDLPGFANNFASESLNGLICLEVGSQYRICNPIVREFITVPWATVETQYPQSYSLYGTKKFGYDPINGQHKILSTHIMKEGHGDEGDSTTMMMENKVFVLGDHSWRRICDGPPHFPYSEGVCVDGVVYYIACTTTRDPYVQVVIAFDVELETFRSIPLPGDGLHLYEESGLIRYDESIAIIDYQLLKYGNNVQIWVFQDDPVKPNWDYKTIVCSPSWINIVGDCEFYLAGTLRNGEVIMVPRSLRKPFHLFYLDLKSPGIRKVEIQGLPDYELRGGGFFRNISVTDHVESILSLSGLDYATSSY